MTRWFRAALFTLVALFVLAPSAVAADPVSDAINALRSDPVFVATPALSARDASKLRDLIRERGNPVYVAVLPPLGDVDSLPERIGRGVGLPGAYVVVSGNSIRAGSSDMGLDRGEAGRLATDALRAHNPRQEGSIMPMLEDFVRRVDSSLDRHSSRVGGSTRRSGHSTNWGAIFGWLFGGLAGIAAFVFAAVGIAGYRRRKREAAAEKAAYEQSLRTAKTRLATLTDEVLQLSGDVKLHEKASASYQSANVALSRASGIIDSAQTSDDVRNASAELARVEAELEDVRAYVAGRDPVAEREAEAQRQAELEAQRARERDERRRQREAEEAERRERVARITPENYTPATSRGAGRDHYFEGGYYNNTYYGPGWYSDPFWTWVMIDAMHDDHHDHGYHRDDYDYDHSSSYGSDDNSGGGDWSSSSSSSGGGDWGSSSSSYDSGGDWSSSSSSSDWGGSFDSGSSSGGGDW